MPIINLSDIGVTVETFSAWLASLNDTGQQTALRYLLESLEKDTSERILYFVLKEIAARLERGNWPY